MYTYFVPEIDNFSFTSKNDVRINPNNVMRTLFTQLSRRKLFTQRETLYRKHETRFCNFCQRQMPNSCFKFTINHDDRGNLFLTSLGAKNDKGALKIYKCDYPDCRCQALNHNSIEYVSIAYNLTTDDARSYIHSRNKSPFYRSNFNSDEEYKEYQSHASLTPEQRNTDGRLRTYYENKKRHIEEYGVESWNNICKNKDTMTYESCLRRIGDETLAYEEYLRRKQSVVSYRPTYDSSVTDIEEWLRSDRYNVNCVNSYRNLLIEKLSNRGDFSKTLFIDKTIRKISAKEHLHKLEFFIWMGIKVFNINDIYDFVGISKKTKHVASKFCVKMYAYPSTCDGFFFRSDAEYTLYDKMLSVPHIKVLDTNKSYPGATRKMYDFKIQYLGEVFYIEVCSNVDSEYVENVLQKQSKFGSICILPKYFGAFIDDAMSGKNIVTGRYYEHS